MKPISGKDMCKLLKKRGWYQDHVSGSHYIYKNDAVPGSLPVPVHGTKMLKPKTQKSIMRTAGLTDADL